MRQVSIQCHFPPLVLARSGSKGQSDATPLSQKGSPSVFYEFLEL